MSNEVLAELFLNQVIKDFKKGRPMRKLTNH